jgi:pseudomonalisin
MGFARQFHALPNPGMAPAAITSVYPIQITTSSLPDATNGVSYSATFTAIGGVAPYLWTILSGSLPPGLSLSTSGVISGTPTTPGVYNFTVQVTDTIGNSAALSVGVGL